MKIIDGLQKIYKKTLQDRTNRIYYKISLNHSAKPDIFHALNASDKWNLGQALENKNQQRLKVIQFEYISQELEKNKQFFDNLNQGTKGIYIKQIEKQLMEADKMNMQNKSEEQLQEDKAYNEQMINRFQPYRPMKNIFEQNQKKKNKKKEQK